MVLKKKKKRNSLITYSQLVCVQVLCGGMAPAEGLAEEPSEGRGG